MTTTVKPGAPRGANRRLRCALGAAALLMGMPALSAPGPAAAAPSLEERRRPGPVLKVLSQNVYLGADLTQAVAAPDLTAFLNAVAAIYADARASNFPVRAEALASQIAKRRPDVIGLQEVAHWVATGPGAAGEIDFLDILMDALAAEGLGYKVAAVGSNADLGPIPLVSPCDSTTFGACTLRLVDRDVILVRTDRQALTWSNPQSGTFADQASFTPPAPGASPVSFDRGWVSIDGTVRGTRFHFANTHLEVSGFAAIQEAQAAEFLAGPAKGPGIDIAVGDLNSNADGSGTASYAIFREYFADAWSVNTSPGFTCCRDDALADPNALPTRRIDFVLTRPRARAIRARVIGLSPISAERPIYTADHLGVLAALRIIPRR